MDNDSDDDLLLLLHLRRRRKKAKSKHRRRMWVRPIFQQRRHQGDFHQLLQELRRNDPESHFRFLRMSKETFDCLVEKLTTSLTTRFYRSGTGAEISPAESFRVGHLTVCSIIRDSSLYSGKCCNLTMLKHHQMKKSGKE
ncbi:uncharacterized protein LOC134190671 isoform X1 [Corticium candelabrum]|uniref:uncharacterized protein LOC134190671 isoform X1 n=1 Tax=Corticium candelabrum TaxID=121492 RepID=UPI002E253249|nr:uncharacterized protein LOC134190671 isoform X1 [Corticium candelabrum]